MTGQLHFHFIYIYMYVYVYVYIYIYIYIYGETVETVSDFIFLGSKITTDGDCSREIKRHFLLGRKAMTNLDSILKAETLLC